MSDFQMSDALTDAEHRFPIDTLLECEYFQKYRRGYHESLNKTTLRQVWAGYDWSDSIFDDPATRFLTGVIYFNRGDYASRKFLFNPQVATISRAHPRREAFDMEKVLSNPNPKIFDPKKVVTASELFDVDEFVRTIHEGRDVALKDSQE